ncbi:hypothetical protein [Streptomyces sp. 1222.5]|uniref:hypothetical protein n=1 Tax=Streptomyces sp. 1222.5 TaxID=1881026 RepID=UPI003EBE924B
MEPHCAQRRTRRSHPAPDHRTPRALRPGVLAQRCLDTLQPSDRLTDGDLDSGTTLCVAGFATHLTGYTLKAPRTDHDEVRVSKPGQPSAPIYEAACAELRLSDDDATWLFWGRRTPAQIRAALGQLAAGADGIDHADIGSTLPATP